MIKNLLFDMGGVIFNQDTEEAFRRFREAGIDTDYYMGKYGQKDFFLDLEAGNIDDREFCRRMSEVVGRTVSWDEAQYCWLGYFDGVPEERLRHLEALRKDYHLCLLSNTNPFVMAYTRSSHFSDGGKPITDFFDTLFCSYEMKCCKPADEIFLKALGQDGMAAEECLFVDDSQANCDAARRLGFHALRIESNSDWMAGVNEIIRRNYPHP